LISSGIINPLHILISQWWLYMISLNIFY
jgi:hypothetical protein